MPAWPTLEWYDDAIIPEFWQTRRAENRVGLLRQKTTECVVGVIGLANSGKTVLLTSLLNHLADHDPERFRLTRPGAAIRRFRHRPTDAGWTEFPYSAHRDQLVHRGKWPAKTKDRYQIVCQLERSDWTYSDLLLKIYDLPGERIADVPMAQRNYAEWSDEMLRRLRTDTGLRNDSAEFLAETESASPTEAVLLGAYRLGLARQILQYKPLVSPSAFLLNLEGDTARGSDAHQLADNRCVGLGPESQFCPLPPNLRGTTFGNVFAARYETYRQTVVLPFVEALRSCHSLAVVVDVLTILAGGDAMYNDTRHLLQEVFQALDPGESLFGTVGRKLSKVFLPYQLRPAWIHRVAFVAPKLDQIPPIDRDRQLHLLKRLVGKIADDRDGLDKAYFNCAAVVSTKVMPGGTQREMVGIPLRDADGEKIAPGAEQRFTPSAVPDGWPPNWPPGQFYYPEVYPKVPALKDCPPEQLNLDALFGFLTDV
ncbi:MAG: YcjX family protein [Gemmataceae bacterium]